MGTRGALRAWFLVALTLLGVGSVSRTLNAGERVRFAIVVARNSPVDELSLYDLKRLYEGETVNAAGKRLLPLNLPPASDSRVRFDQAVLGMTPERVSRYWIDRKIRGQSGPPRALDSADLVQRVVARLDGGIGYVRMNELKADVKVVRVDGKSPKDSGYPVEF